MGPLSEEHPWGQTMVHKVQTDLYLGRSKQGCGGGRFNLQELLRDGQHVRGFGRELDSVGDRRELAGATTFKEPWDSMTWRMSSVLFT